MDFLQKHGGLEAPPPPVAGLPVSGGPRGAGSTPSAPDGARHRSSEPDGERQTGVNGGYIQEQRPLMEPKHTHLPHQPEGPVQAPGVRVLPHFVVEPAQFGQSAAGVPQGFA